VGRVDQLATGTALLSGSGTSLPLSRVLGTELPARCSAGLVIATLIRPGGISGQKNRIPSRKFVIDFGGGRWVKVEPVITASRRKAIGFAEERSASRVYIN
jgi:hypothetical protein